MVAAVSDHFNHLVERLIIIDCRYPYEFIGGHIKVSKISNQFAETQVAHTCLVPFPYFVAKVFGFIFVTGRSEPAPGRPGGGFPPQNTHPLILPRQTRRHHLPLRVLVGARPSNVPLRQGARPRHERVSQTPLPRTLHPQGRIQRLLPWVQGQYGFRGLNCSRGLTKSIYLHQQSDNELENIGLMAKIEWSIHAY